VEEQIPIAYFVFDREERNRRYVRNHSTNERRRNEFQSGGFLRTVRETGTGAASSNQPNTFLNGGFLRTVRDTGTGAASSNQSNYTH